MNRRNFALSWGRKTFFGIAWPTSALLMLVYLQSQLIPLNGLSWIYFIATLIGLSGFITSVVYFLIYCPLILIFPSYYFTRLWALFLILLVNAALYLDAMMFIQFRFHINQFVLNTVMNDGLNALFQSSAPMTAMIILAAVLAIVIWFRGERTWRSMQKRFSNPVKNWYLVLIVACMVISHVLYQSGKLQSFNEGQNVASLFPLDYQNMFFSRAQAETGMRFFYPKKELKCSGKALNHIFIISVGGLSAENYSEEQTPFIYHLPDHGTDFKGHRFLASDRYEAIFSLLYGLPAYYRDLAKSTKPAIVSEASKRGYQFFVYSDVDDLKVIGELQSTQAPLVDQWRQWKMNKEAPLFAVIDLHRSPVSASDLEIRDLLNELHVSGVMKDSLFVITGSYAQDAIPLNVVWPDRRKGEWTHLTTHYDVAASVMQNLWNCKNNFADYSEGKSLFLASDKGWNAFGNENELMVLDHNGNKIITSDWQGHLSEGGSSHQRDLVMKAMRAVSRFYKE